MTDIKGFLIVVVPIVLSPGVSLILAISNVSAMGLRGSLIVIAGTGVGLLVHGVVAGIGVSKFVSQSPFQMRVLNMVGVVFLVFMGVKQLLNSLRLFGSKTVFKERVVGFKEALFPNVFNFKAILLYASVVPLFAGERMMGYFLFVMIHILIMASWILFVCYFLALAGRRFDLNYLGRFVNIVGGLFLIFVAGNAANVMFN